MITLHEYNSSQWSPVPAEGMGLTPRGADVVSSSPELRLLSERSSPLREELVETVTYMYHKRRSAIGWMDGWIYYRVLVLPLLVPDS